MEENMILVLGGHIGCGKSTAAKAIMDRLNVDPRYQATIVSFGATIRKEVSELYGIPLEIMFNNDLKTTPVPLAFMTDEAVRLFYDCGIVHPIIDPRNISMSPRQLLQIHGTDIRRNHFGRDYWILQFHKDVTSFFETEGMETKVVIIDDMRFAEEYEAVSQYPNLCFKLETYARYSHDLSHASESFTKEFDAWEYRFSAPYGCLDNYVIDPILAKVFDVHLEFEPDHDIRLMSFADIEAYYNTRM